MDKRTNDKGTSRGSAFVVVYIHSRNYARERIDMIAHYVQETNAISLLCRVNHTSCHRA